MKYKRIVIGFILSAALILNQFTVFSANARDDDVNYVTAAVRLGLMPQKLAANPSGEVSRGDAISSVINLYSENTPSAEDAAFSDINSKSEYYEAVCRGKNLGLVSGFPDNTVRIDEKMSVNHAVKMILYALGYRQVISDGMSLGDAAAQAGFCSAGDAYDEGPLTVSKLARLMIKGGETKILLSANIRSNGSDMRYDYKLSEKTLFEERLNISWVSGIVTYCGGADLTLENAAGEDKVIIDGVSYNDTVTAENYIGCNVRAYYRTYSTSGEKDILYMYPKNNEILEIAADDISDYSGGKLYYYENGKRQSENLNIGSVDFIYNNSICTNPTEKNLKPEDGFVRIIDNDRDGITDVVVCENYETVVVDSVSKNDKVIYGMFGNVKIELDKYENVQFVSETNEKFDIFELSKWDVLSVARSEGLENIKLVYAYGVIEGTADEIDYSPDGSKLVIGGETYKVTADFAKYEFPDISAGTGGTFYLNTSGKIAAYNEAGVKNYGFMIKSDKLPNKMDDETGAKMLTSSGKIQIFNYAKKVSYNGTSVLRAVLSAIPENTLCIYELNSDGDIKSIDTARGSYGLEESGQNDVIRKVYDGYTKDDAGMPDTESAEALTYKSNTAILGGKVCLASNAVVFEIPVGEEKADEKYYKTYKRDDYAENDKEMRVQAYNSDPDAIAADAVVVYVKRGSYDASAVYDDTHIWVINKIYNVMDDTGNARKQLELTDGKMRASLFADTAALDSLTLNGKAYALKEGDIIRCDYDEDNNITACVVLYSAKSGEMGISNPSTDSFAASFRVELCYAYKIKESLLVTTRDDVKNSASFVDEASLKNKQLRNLSSYGIVYYNSEKQEVSSGSGDLLKDYIRNGRDCSKMFIFDRYGDAKTLVIYE